jgi:casein kinase II subunit alpha
MENQGDPEELKLNAKWCGEYGTVNTLRPKDYSWYNAMKIEYSDITNYECWKKIGRGKYSEVYLGYCKSNN